ncbi:MAG: ATP-dependent Clp protease adaptor ClpS [Bacteroidetes bacterium]|nr:ATP-dependent Clp protease adaptor ClpS [Bacteroidota bacterium]
MVKQKDNPSSIQQDHSTTQRRLILFNDDVNTFDYVIDALICVCNHEHEQAEQCALITHFKGKCNIKSGDYDEIKPMYEEMTIRGLTVSIE